VVPQLVTVDHVLFTKIMMPAASDDPAAVMLQIHDDFSQIISLSSRRAREIAK